MLKRLFFVGIPQRRHAARVLLLYGQTQKAFIRGAKTLGFPRRFWIALKAGFSLNPKAVCVFCRGISGVGLIADACRQIFETL